MPAAWLAAQRSAGKGSPATTSAPPVGVVASVASVASAVVVAADVSAVVVAVLASVSSSPQAMAGRR